MILNPRFPKFEDGEFLSEIDLYILAWFSLELFASSQIAKGHIGFFAPTAEDETAWNVFEREDDYVRVDNLFVISPDGIPFIMMESRTLNINRLASFDTPLVATVYIAEGSQAFKDKRFLFAPEFDEYLDHETDYDYVLEEKVESSATNSYQLRLHWGNETAPDIVGAKRFDLILGTLQEVEGTEFVLEPLAYFTQALPPLNEAVFALQSALEDFTKLVLNPNIAAGVERNTLLHTLELFSHSLSKEFNPTHAIIHEAKSMLKTVKGFYLRIAYALDRANPTFISCRGLEGKMLEHQLELTELRASGELGAVIEDIVSLLDQDISTGAEQIEFFKRFEAIFGSARQAELFASLVIPELEPVNAKVTPRPPEPPRERSKPSGPRIIDLNKKNV